MEIFIKTFDEDLMLWLIFGLLMEDTDLSYR